MIGKMTQRFVRFGLFYFKRMNFTKNYINLNMENNINPIVNEEKKIQKEKVKIEKKMNKKLAKALNVILLHENNSIENLFSEEPTLNLWIYHFGNGDEDDQVNIRKYFNETFGPCKVYIFPGICYGFIEFIDIKDSERVRSINDKQNYNYTKIKGNSHPIKFSNGERTVFTFYSKIELKDVLHNNEEAFPIAQYKCDIPGLYVIDDFITEEEQKKLIEDIDSNDWNKMSHRRVQHYGYEFLYGANSINKNNKIGELPKFCDEVMNSIKYITKGLKNF
jgi:alkylated DNA repair protein alkB family protein 8